MNPEDFKKIISAWIDGSISPENRQLLNSLLMQPEYQEMLDGIMQQQQQQGYELQPGYQEAWLRMRQSIRQHTSRQPQSKLRSMQYWWAAAALLVLTAGAWFLLSDKKVQPSGRQQPVAIAEEIKPAGDGAILTLADGSSIVLDSMGNGTVIRQRGTDAVLANGQLKYNDAGEASENYFNTLTTPRGKQFRIVLPDGTIAWLNAASSIRFPTRFSDKERKVSIEGEVYFEVAAHQKDGRKLPFLVDADQQFTVEVLGTHFNVNAYRDEPSLNTTLLEGKVQVAVPGLQKVVLQSGQQAALRMKSGGPKLTVQQADTEKVMAWKNGIFNFENATLDEVMRQLERWYNIDVKYESVVPKIEFVGKMTRDIPLSGIILALEKSNVHFRLDGRTLVVTP